MKVAIILYKDSHVLRTGKQCEFNLISNSLWRPCNNPWIFITVRLTTSLLYFYPSMNISTSHSEPFLLSTQLDFFALTNSFSSIREVSAEQCLFWESTHGKKRMQGSISKEGRFVHGLKHPEGIIHSISARSEMVKLTRKAVEPY